MPLEPIQLDDMTWSDLTTAARSRIAGVSNGEWTLHAPVDPGITLLELFAAQLDQRVYWMDQPSDELKAAMLSLLGIQPRPESIAGTVFCLFGGESAASMVLDAGAVVEQITDETPRRFTIATDQATQILPIKWCVESKTNRARRSRTAKQKEVDVLLMVGDQNRSSELKTGRLPCLLPADGSPRETRFAFRLKHVPAGLDHISLFFELDTPGTIQPQWLPDPPSTGFEQSVTVQPAARLSWHYCFVTSENPLDDAARLNPFTSIDDGTNGFRRSGVIRFGAPLGIELCSKLESSDFLWLVFVVRIESGSYTFIPRVRQILPNAVIGSHRVRYDLPKDSSKQNETTNISEQIERWRLRKLSGNRLDLPLTQGEFPIPATVNFRLNERNDANGASFPWFPTDNFSHRGPTDRNFVVDRDRRALLFGDGLNGRLPVPAGGPKDDVVFDLLFDVGGGKAGNVPSHQRWRLTSPERSELYAVNVVPAQGGEDAETIDEAVRRSRSELRRPCRAVTKNDIEQLARQTPGAGIKRAHAAVGFHPQHPCVPTPGAVTVFVVPDLPPSLRRFMEQSCGDDLIAVQPDSGALWAVAERLNAARLVTHEIFVRPPVYEPIGLSVVISGTPVDPDSVRESVTHALHEYLHPLYGGPDEDGWPFGCPLRPSELVRVLRDAIDQELEVKEVGIRKLGPEGNATSLNMCAKASCCSDAAKSDTDNAPRFESCRDVDIKPNALVALRSVQITFGPSRAQTGGLL